MRCQRSEVQNQVQEKKERRDEGRVHQSNAQLFSRRRGESLEQLRGIATIIPLWRPILQLSFLRCACHVTASLGVVGCDLAHIFPPGLWSRSGLWSLCLPSYPATISDRLPPGPDLPVIVVPVLPSTSMTKESCVSGQAQGRAHRWMKPAWPYLALVLTNLLYLLRAPQFIFRPWNHLADHGDSILTAWVLAWEAHALVTPGLSVWNSPIFFPVTNALAFSEVMFADLPLTLPIQYLTGNPLLANNVLLLFSFLFSSFAFFYLVRELTGSRLAGLIAGILFAHNPFRWNMVCHVQLLPIFWSIFAVAFAVRWSKRRRRRDWFLMLAMVVGQFYASIYLGIMLVIFVSAVIGVLLIESRLARERVFENKARALVEVGILLLGVAVAVGLLWPLARPYLEVKETWGMVRTLEENLLFSIKWRDLVTPSRAFANYSFLNASPVPPSRETDVFFGATPWLLAFLGVLSWRRQGSGRMLLGFGAAGLLMLVLMFGPFLSFHLPRDLPGFHSDGGYCQVTLPFAVIHKYFPGAGALRVPARFGQFFLISLCVFAGYGIAFLERIVRVRPVGIRMLIPVLGFALFFYDYQLAENRGFAVPSAASFPGFYRKLAETPEREVLLELPVGVGGRHDTLYPYRYLLYQTSHWSPKIDGTSGFAPGWFYQLGLQTDGPASPHALQVIAASPAKVVAIHLDNYLAKNRTSWETASLEPFGFAKTGRFGNVLVWTRTSPQEGEANAAPKITPERPLLLSQGNVTHLVVPFKALSPSQGIWVSAANPRLTATFEIDRLSRKTISGARQIRLYPDANGNLELEPLDIILEQPARDLSTSRVTIRVSELAKSWQGIVPVPMTATSAFADSGLRYRVDGPILEKPDIELRPGEQWTAKLTVTNTGQAVWLNHNFSGAEACPEIYGTVHAGFFWYKKKDFEALSRIPASFEGATKAEAVPVGRIVRPGEQVELQAQLKAPDEPGEYVICFDLVSHCVTWFKNVGDNRTPTLHVQVSGEPRAF